MAEPNDDADHIAQIQRKTNETIRYAAIGIGMIGGPRAVVTYLDNTLGELLLVAIDQQGAAHARELMAAGMMLATEELRR